MSNDEIARRVQQCFSNVLPAVPPEQIAALRQENVAEWDSVVHVTLLAALAEEFGIEIDLESAQDMTSVAAAEEMVRAALAR